MRNAFRYYAILVLTLGIAASFSGCKTSEESDTRFVNRQVVNTTMGFNGFKFLIPSGYEQINPKSEDPELKTPIKYYDSVVKFFKNDSALEYRESMLFGNGKSFIIFVLDMQRMSEPYSQMTDFKRSRILLDGMDRHHVFKDENLIPGEVGTENGKLFGHTTYLLKNDYIEEQYNVLGNLRETYRFFGVTSKENERTMQSDLRAMIYSLQF